ncbi:MAG: biotin/lipoyl-binding protein [Proteobacteria bacterium]|nr:MAG: biotin/lipoyl-binding protein [Pseudomonadota bacterium]
MNALGKNLVWLLATLAVLGMSIGFRPGSESFLGVAQSTDRILSTSSSGVVSKINVKAGQAVKKGDVLIELSDVNLQLTINEAKYNLKKSQFEKNFAERLDPGRGEDASADISINQYQNDLKLKMKQQDSLKIVALQDGFIGDISTSVGEIVQSFQPLAIFYVPKASRIRGYLHENAKLALKAGDKVHVQSAVDLTKLVEAEVLSVGERYTEFPLRLKPSLQASETLWAREVEIELPQDNHFLPLEKVKIMANADAGFFQMIYPGSFAGATP